MSNITTKKEKFADLKRRLDEQKSQSVAPRAEFDTEMLEAIDSVDEPTLRLDIMDIRADRTQPRQAIPSLIGLNWNGNPEQVIDLIGQWRRIAEQRAGVSIPVEDILQGRNEKAFELEAAHPYFIGFLDLLTLAQSIHREGLSNPVNVIRSAGKYAYVIESGERRWLAHHILNHFIDSKYGRVKAVEGDVQESAWRQCSENNQRANLNAIGKARQIAKLIMECRAGLTDYIPYDDIVVGCNRIFFAQVANGNVHKIPDGMGGRIQAALHMKKGTISDYRSLLALTEDNEVNDILWMRADDEWWTQDVLLSLKKIPLDTLREIVLREAFTLEELKKEVERFGIPNHVASHHPVDDGAKPTPPPKNQLTVGTVIEAKNIGYWRIKEADYMNDKFMCESPSGFFKSIDYQYIVGIDNNKADLFKPKATSTYTTSRKETSSTATPVDFEVGQRVIIDGNPNIKGVVSRKSAGGYTVNLMVGGSRWFEKNRLTPVDKFSDTPSQPRSSSVGAQGGHETVDDDYTTPLEADEFEDADEWDDEPVDNTPDYEPFDQGNLEILNSIADVADMADDEWAWMIEDLCLLDRKKLQQWVTDGGIEEVERMAVGYRQAKESVLMALGERIDQHIDSVVTLARKMAEE